MSGRDPVRGEQQEPGTATTFSACCGWCGGLHSFHPTHEDLTRARTHLSILGWKLVGRFGWTCPSCQRSRRSAGKEIAGLSRPQITLPGFGKVSR